MKSHKSASRRHSEAMNRYYGDVNRALKKALAEVKRHARLPRRRKSKHARTR